MAGTYTQLYIHVVFAVQGRANLLGKDWRGEVFSYIAGILRNLNQKPIIVNGVADHVHVFFGLLPTASISEIVKHIKSNSSSFINNKKYIKGKFKWQEGFGAFSYSRSQLKSVYKYIQSQEEHHKKTTFKEEYLELLRKFEVDYNEKYVFEWIEETNG
ncbi:MAG: IS200/IS605 family transposase [Candidatus Kapabacteria bacterium]|nr:IS200/IS605 family transposase [Candidatus Kapabacteria bacterium]